MTPQKTEPKLPASVGGPPLGRQGLTTGYGGHWKVPLGINPLELTINPTIEPQIPGLGCLRANNYQGGSATPPHLSADKWIKALLSKALPTRARPSFSHHQSLPSRSLHKPISLIHQRANRRCKKKHSLIAAKTKSALQKVNHDEKAERYVPDEGTRQNSRKTTK